MSSDILLNFAVSIFIQAYEDAAEPNRYADVVWFLQSDWCDFLLGYLSLDVRDKYLKAINDRLGEIKPSSGQLWLLDCLTNYPDDFKAILDDLKGVWRIDYFYPMYVDFCNTNGFKPLSALQLSADASPAVHNWYDNALSLVAKKNTPKTKKSKKRYLQIKTNTL